MTQSILESLSLNNLPTRSPSLPMLKEISQCLCFSYGKRISFHFPFFCVFDSNHSMKSKVWKLQRPWNMKIWLHLMMVAFQTNWKYEKPTVIVIYLLVLLVSRAAVVVLSVKVYLSRISSLFLIYFARCKWQRMKRTESKRVAHTNNFNSRWKTNITRTPHTDI